MELFGFSISKELNKINKYYLDTSKAKKKLEEEFDNSLLELRAHLIKIKMDEEHFSGDVRKEADKMLHDDALELMELNTYDRRFKHD